MKLHDMRIPRYRPRHSRLALRVMRARALHCRDVGSLCRKRRFETNPLAQMQGALRDTSFALLMTLNVTIHRGRLPRCSRLDEATGFLVGGTGIASRVPTGAHGADGSMNCTYGQHPARHSLTYRCCADVTSQVRPIPQLIITAVRVIRRRAARSVRRVAGIERKRELIIASRLAEIETALGSWPARAAR